MRHTVDNILTVAQVTELRALYDRKVFRSSPSTFRLDWTRMLDALATIEQCRQALEDLLHAIDASPYGVESIHHHTCPAPDHGKCSCGAYAAVDEARRALGED